MDLHASYALLRISTPDLPSLSFAAAQPEALHAWLGELPKANLGEVARRLYSALQELNRLQTPPANRLQLLELLQPEVQYACSQLQKHLRSQAVILDERRQQIANLCQTLQLQLARAAKLTAIEAARLPGAESAAAGGALLIALQALYRVQYQFSLFYLTPPRGFWLELHQLYRDARQRQLERQPLPGATGTQTIEQHYLACLLFACARTNQLRQQAIQQLAEALPAWSTRARLQDAQRSDSLFALAPATDSPPRYARLLQGEPPAQLLGIDPQHLVADLRQYLQLGQGQRLHAHLPVPLGLGDELLQHLCAAWSPPAQRAFRRSTATGHLSACIGIRSLHYYAAGQRPFAAVLQRPETEISVDFQRRQQQRDAWSNAFDTDRDERLLQRPGERIDYQPISAAASASDEEHPRHNLQVLDRSPGGYRLAWDGGSSTQLQSGDLIGLQHPGETGWHVAMIRWIRQQHGAGLQLGVELLAPRAQPCGLRPLPKADQPSHYLRALRLEPIPALDRPAVLIVPHLPFQQGQKLLLNHDGQEQRILLGQRHVLSASFNQFEYRLLETPEESQPPAARKSLTGLRLEGEAGLEGFDSLWESL